MIDGWWALGNLKILSKAAIYWNTLRHLKPGQFYWRLRRRSQLSKFEAVATTERRDKTGNFVEPARRRQSILSDNRVSLLNADDCLSNRQIWNDPKHSKLWLYNLHYLDDLNAFDAKDRVDVHKNLVARWILENPPTMGNGWEPYPISLRVVNLIKWVLTKDIADVQTEASIAAQANYLSKVIELHLLGNHLFSNAKALVFAGSFFETPLSARWLASGLAILDKQVAEQVLADGGNFERSPMYHALMLEDLLDLINLSTQFSSIVPETQILKWKSTSELMLSWLAAMSHPDGQIAFFNDAANGVAPSNDELFRYAKELGLSMPSESFDQVVYLEPSGYVRVTRGHATAIIDVAPVGPDYLPGHAHADTLSFELSIRGARWIVNGGTSRYGNCDIRQYERSTAAHSTVEVGGVSSSEVWHGFRVARRSYPFDIEMQHMVEVSHVGASHTGYHRLRGKPTHRRTWAMSERHLKVHDTVLPDLYHAAANYIIHPDVKVADEGAGRFGLTGSDGSKVSFTILSGQGRIMPSWFAPEFGERLPTTAIAVDLFAGQSEISIEWN